MSKVTVYSKPGCQGCFTTKIAFKRKGVDFEEIDVTKDEAGMNRIIELGFSSLPVVCAEGFEPWSGFRDEKIKEVIEATQAGRELVVA